MTDQRPTILVCDDEPDVRGMLEEYLKRRGFDVILAEDSIVLRAKIADHAVDLILLDINMPRMNGFELKQRLSEISTLNTIPVIFLTTSSAPSDIDNAYKLGGNAYLTKPGDLGGMRRVVESFSAFWLRSAQLPQR